MALRVWLPLNGSVENKGISDTVMSGSPASWGNGKIGKCAIFTGNVGNVIYNNTTDYNYTDKFSWTVWVNTNYTGTTAQFAFTNGRADAGGYGYGLQCTNTTTCNIRFGNQSYGVAVTGGEWTHLAFTKSGTSIKVYKNGSIVTDTTFSGTLPTYSDGNGLGLGCFHYSGNIYPFYGSLNDFRIYDHCLSAKEVKEISQGLVLHYKLDGWSGGVGENLAYGTNTADVSTNVWRLSNQAGGTTNSIEYDGNTPVAVITRDDVAQSGWTYLHYDNIHPADIKTSTTYTISFDVMASVDGTIGISALMQGNATNSKSKSVTNIQSICTANTWSHIVLQTVTKDDFTDINNSQVIYLNTSASLRAVNVTIKMKNMKMEIGPKDTPWSPALTEISIDTTKITDSSGYGNDGTILSNPYTNSDADRYQISTHFDGADDGILIENLTLSSIINDQVTYSFWIKPESENGGRSVYFGSYSSTSWSVEKTTGNVLRLYWNGSPDETCSGATITDGIWQHIVITKNGTNNIKVYINGTQKWTSTAAHNTLSFPTTYRIGRDTRSGDGTPYHGLMSDFRIYATALSAEDILDLYHTPANIDNLQNIHAFELKDNEDTSQTLKNGIMATKEFHESNSELLNNFSSGGYAPAKDKANSCVNMGIADFSNYADLNKDLSIHIECDIEWTTFTAGTGGTFNGIWWQGSQYDKTDSTWKWAGTNYVCRALQSSFAINATRALTAGTHHYDVITTVPASWFNTYSKSNIGFRCDYSDGTGRIDVTNFKITPSQYYNAKIGKDFISANNFIEK